MHIYLHTNWFTQRSMHTKQTHRPDNLKGPSQLAGCVVFYIRRLNYYFALAVGVPRPQGCHIRWRVHMSLSWGATYLHTVWNKKPSSISFGLPNLFWSFGRSWVSLWVPSDVMGSESSTGLAACQVNQKLWWCCCCVIGHWGQNLVVPHRGTGGSTGQEEKFFICQGSREGGQRAKLWKCEEVGEDNFIMRWWNFGCKQ